MEVQDEPFVLKDFPVIEYVVGWLEMVQYNYKQADTISDLVLSGPGHPNSSIWG